MYEHLLSSSWNLNKGNSGSPVLGQDMECIGVHTYGGEQNFATVIGKRGCSFAPYFEALDAQAQRKLAVPRLETEKLNVVDVLKLIKRLTGSIPKDLLLTDTGFFLGPLTVPAGAVANLALSAAASR
ncbi:hypothetical protein BBP40_000267 [Aspergillus hancockii]|nr:hypothetical protein BBP40_000267 [Aspergillus hancockii]